MPGTNLLGKKAIITGGSRGIGKAIALTYAKQGADVVITYHIQKEEAEAVVHEIEALGRKALAIQVNMICPKDRKKLVEEAKAFLGEINILVNNAGVYFKKAYLEVTEEDYRNTMETNTTGPYFLTQLVCKEMIRQQKGGSVINMSSFRDKIVGPEMSHYQVSKAGLTMFSGSIALEMANNRIRVNTISPGTILTDMHRPSMKNNPVEWSRRVEAIPLKRAGTVEDICAMAILLASDDGSSYITGGRFLIDGGRSLGAAVPSGNICAKL